MKILSIIILSLGIYFNFSLISIYAADCKKPKMPSSEEWNSWIEEFKIFALNEGISEKTIDDVLTDVEPSSKILLRDKCQVESTITLDEYLYYRLDKARIIAGKNIMKKYQNFYLMGNCLINIFRF